MLGKVFGSNSRVKLLKLFLFNSEKKFYIRQVARDLGLQLNSVRRELENLEKFGLLISNPEDDNMNEENINEDEDEKRIKVLKEANKKKTKKRISILKRDKKYYQVNQDFVLYEEIKALMIKSQILYEKDFIEKILAAGRPKLLVLTGFFVNKLDSSVDLLIVGKLNKNKLMKLIKSLEDDLGKEINYTIMGIGEFRYRRDITDVFLFDILEGKKMVIINELE